MTLIILPIPPPHTYIFKNFFLLPFLCPVSYSLSSYVIIILVQLLFQLRKVIYT